MREKNKSLRHRASLGRGSTVAGPSFAILTALSTIFPTAAARAADVPPTAGSILQQVQPVKPPQAQPSTPSLTIQRQGSPGAETSEAFKVSTIEIAGNTLFDTATLHALVADVEDRSLTLAQLEAAVARITAHYRQHGYPLARAALPAQTIQNGVVKVVVVEARYGEIALDNTSRVADALLRSTLASLQSGGQIEQAPLDHALLLLSDIPGTTVLSTLKPGATVGSSDLTVAVTPTAPVTGNVALDNNGDSATGRARVSGGVSVLEPFHHGDVLAAHALSAGQKLDYGDLSYGALLNGTGTRLGAAVSALHYRLGDNLASLGGHGTAEVGSVSLRQPLLRSRVANLAATLQADHKVLDDRIDSTHIDTKRHLNNVSLGLSGDATDSWLAGAVNSFALAVTSGRLAFDNDAASNADLAGARTQGHFSKMTLNYARLQNLSAADSVYVNVAGQLSSTNLDASEKMVAGGPYTVRAYDIGVASGDQGIFGTIEWHHDIGGTASGRIQVGPFLDGEYLRIDRKPVAAPSAGNNGANLAGAGVSLNWAGPQNWAAKLSIATRLNHAPAVVGKADRTRGWIEVGKFF